MCEQKFNTIHTIHIPKYILIQNVMRSPKIQHHIDQLCTQYTASTTKYWQTVQPRYKALRPYIG